MQIQVTLLVIIGSQISERWNWICGLLHLSLNLPAHPPPPYRLPQPLPDIHWPSARTSTSVPPKNDCLQCASIHFNHVVTLFINLCFITAVLFSHLGAIHTPSARAHDNHTPSVRHTGACRPPQAPDSLDSDTIPLPFHFCFRILFYSKLAVFLSRNFEKYWVQNDIYSV